MTKLCCFEKNILYKYIAKNEVVRILFGRYYTSCIALISQIVNHMYTPTKLESVLGYKNCGFSSVWLSIHLFTFCPGCNWDNTGSSTQLLFMTKGHVLEVKCQGNSI